jgi:hexosaminidase
MTRIRGIPRRRDSAGPLPITPKPRSIARGPGRFELRGDVAVTHDPGLAVAGARLARAVAAALGLPGVPARAPAAGHGDIAMTLDAALEAPLGAEGYQLSVSPQGVQVRASSAAGALHAVQTLRQLLPAGAEPGAIHLPCVEIEDAPRFSWRGFMLDEGRYFHGKATVKTLLDLMELHKLNVFHWHLTEDQGWRIEMRRHPELTRIGSARKGSTKSLRGRPDGVPHAGFYTQADIREIVAYAAERAITVVPEVDFPGHARSALAACPWLGCTRGPYEVWDRVGIQPEIMCAGRESTFELLQDVLEEMMELFPAPWVHIGGDEAVKTRWKECPDCRKRMASLGIEEPNALQTWMTNRMAGFLRSHGRETIVWNDSLGPDLDPQIVVQYWLRKRKDVVAEVKRGRRVICSSFANTYLDHGYAFTPLSRAYRYEPVFADLDEASASRVLGIEAPLWTEMVPDLQRMWYQTFPRLCAYAETGWTEKGLKDFDDFRSRLPSLLAHVSALGAGCAPLSAVEPGALRRFFGPLSIFQEQKGVVRA